LKKIKKRPLPRSRDDLLFFNELEENNQESNNNLIDYDLHFLKKEEKEEKEEKKEIVEEISETQKLIIKLTNSGQFRQTEISRFGKNQRSITEN